VLRLLEKDPRRRPSSAAEVARHLSGMAGWFDPAARTAPTPALPTARGEGATGLIDEIKRASERLRQVRDGAEAAHARVVEQLVEFTSRRLHREALRRELDAGPPPIPHERTSKQSSCRSATRSGRRCGRPPWRPRSTGWRRRASASSGTSSRRSTPSSSASPPSAEAPLCSAVASAPRRV